MPLLFSSLVVMPNAIHLLCGLFHLLLLTTEAATVVSAILGAISPNATATSLSADSPSVIGPIANLIIKNKFISPDGFNRS